jgi:hypothetical protein
MPPFTRDASRSVLKVPLRFTATWLSKNLSTTTANPSDAASFAYPFSRHLSPSADYEPRSRHLADLFTDESDEWPM